MPFIGKMSTVSDYIMTVQMFTKMSPQSVHFNEPVNYYETQHVKLNLKRKLNPK